MARFSYYMMALLSAVLMATACGDKDDDDDTPRTFIRADRMGIPAINTVLIPAGMKDTFNDADPANDAVDYQGTAEATITGLRNAVNGVAGFPAEDSPGVPANTLAGVLIPDVVTIDFSQTLAFTNGRRLQDDVVDAAVGLVLNRGNVLGGGAGVSDGINANDKAFSNTFPYLATPF